MKYLTKLLFLSLFVITFVSCEKQEYFKSESTIKKEISFSWKQILMSSDTIGFPKYEIWTFKDDKLIFKRAKVTTDEILDSLSGTFSVHTTLTKVFVTTSGFPDDEGWHHLNAEWTVVALDSKILVMASEDSRAGGLLEREFVRMD